MPSSFSPPCGCFPFAAEAFPLQRKINNKHCHAGSLSPPFTFFPSRCANSIPAQKVHLAVFLHTFYTQIKDLQQSLHTPISHPDKRFTAKSPVTQFKPRQKAYKSPWTHFKQKCSQHSLHTPVLIPDKWFITKSLYTYIKPRQKAHKSPYTHFKRRRKPFQTQTKAISNADKSHFKRRRHPFQTQTKALSQVFTHQFHTHMKGLQHSLHVHMSNLDKRLTTEFVPQYPAGDKSALSQSNKRRNKDPIS